MWLENFRLNLKLWFKREKRGKGNCLTKREWERECMSEIRYMQYLIYMCTYLKYSFSSAIPTRFEPVTVNGGESVFSFSIFSRQHRKSILLFLFNFNQPAKWIYAFSHFCFKHLQDRFHWDPYYFGPLNWFFFYEVMKALFEKNI